MSTLEVNKIIPQGSGTALQIGENGDTITLPTGTVITLPNGSITNDELAGSIANAKLANSTITINGSSVALGGSTTIESGIEWQSSIKTSNFTAVSGKGYFVNTSSNSITVTLPAGSVGDVIELVDSKGALSTNNLLIAANGSEKIQGTTINKTLSVPQGVFGVGQYRLEKDWVLSTGQHCAA